MTEKPKTKAGKRKQIEFQSYHNRPTEGTVYLRRKNSSKRDCFGSFGFLPDFKCVVFKSLRLECRFTAEVLREIADELEALRGGKK